MRFELLVCFKVIGIRKSVISEIIKPNQVRGSSTGFGIGIRLSLHPLTNRNGLTE